MINRKRNVPTVFIVPAIARALAGISAPGDDAERSVVLFLERLLTLASGRATTLPAHPAIAAPSCARPKAMRNGFIGPTAGTAVR